MNMLFDRLFDPGRHDITIDGEFFGGTATVADSEAVIIGTHNKAAIIADLRSR